MKTTSAALPQSQKVELKVIRQAPVDLDGLLKLYPTLLESIEENISRCDEIYVTSPAGLRLRSCLCCIRL